MKFRTEALPIFSLTLVYGSGVGGKDFTVTNPTMNDIPFLV